MKYNFEHYFYKEYNNEGIIDPRNHSLVVAGHAIVEEHEVYHVTDNAEVHEAVKVFLAITFKYKAVDECTYPAIFWLCK